jgi:hypothetical protein
MRVLFLLLLLANLGFAAWAAWHSGPQLPSRPMTVSGPGIEIYREAADADRRAPDAAAGDVPGTAVSLVRCVSIGPLPNRVDVDATVRVLAANGFDARQRVADGEVWLGHWVYIDAIPTQGEAAEIVTLLADNGITEAYVIADGNNGSIVSLGVFSQQVRARQRFADAEALGLSPVVADRTQPGEVFWLDVTARGRAEFASAELAALPVDADLRQERCAGAEAGVPR